MNTERKAVSLILAFLLLFPLVLCASGAEEKAVATLMFASDYQLDQSVYNVHPATTLTDIAAKIGEDGITVDTFVLCGDLTNEDGHSNYNGTVNATKSAVSRTRKIVRNQFGESVVYHALQGNHDPFVEGFTSPTGAYEYDDYIIYIINTEDGNPWLQGESGAEETLKKTAEKMSVYFDGLITAKETRPVFVATHVPLHFSGRTSSLYSNGDNMYSRYLFNALNDAGESLNIVFLFGHNHARGFDNYLGYGSIFIPRGGNILIPKPDSSNSGYTDSYTKEKLNFTYMNAGYIGYINRSEKEENASLTCTVIEIYKDRLVFSRYDKNGLYCLSGEGAFNTYSNYPDEKIFPIQDTSLLSSRTESPYTLSLSIEEVLLGDVDGDGKHTSKDVNLAARMANGMEAEDMRADMNSDGKVSSVDVALLSALVNSD